MTERNIHNQNISNNIMLTNPNYSLKERRLPNDNNNIIIYSLFTKGKPETKSDKVNDIHNIFPSNQEQQIQEEDIDYLKLFSQKNKNTNYNNPNIRQRKSKFFYSNRINTTKNQEPSKIHPQKQRAVSSNFNTVQQKNNLYYQKNPNLNFSKRITSRDEQKIPHSRFNSATERVLENSQKNAIINKKLSFHNKEQRFSGNGQNNMININSNNNMNLNRKKIPIPQNNGYIIHPNVKKVNKIKRESINNANNIPKIKNNNYYQNDNYNNSFNTIHGFYGNTNTNLKLSHHASKDNNASEILNLQNIIEDKENIIPNNNNNSFNYNTICNNNTRNSKIPLNMKLYRNSNAKHLPINNSLTNYNQKAKIIPITNLNEQYIIKNNQNNHIPFANSVKKNVNNNFYTINTEINDTFDGRDYLKENQNIIQYKKQKNPKNLREFMVKKIPQYKNNNAHLTNSFNINNKIEEKIIKYNYEEKENNNPNLSNQITNNPNEYKNETQIVNILDNYTDAQIINELIPNSLNQNQNANQNLYIAKEPKKIFNKQNSQNINSSKIIKLPSKNQIPTGNKKPILIKIPNANNNNNFTQNKNNNSIIRHHSQNINHFPNPEKPIRKDSKSTTSNVTYNPFNASGWLKNFAATTHPGVDKNGNQKTNQDSFVFKTNINGINNFNIFGVMDGHGPQGHFVSQFASKFIPFQIINHREIKTMTDPEDIYQKLKFNEYEIINQIFLETDNQLQKVNFDATESGCTCVLIIHIGSHIICANTGDSRAILVLDSLGENNINDFYEVPLSYDYKPEMPEEKQRIESHGGVVEQLKNKDGEGVGPYRVWAKEGGYPGLAMSRSIGDLVGKKLGVIPNPGILEYELNEKVKFIVVASDGIWEFISNEIVRNIGKKFYKDKDPNGFCHEIVKDAYKLWKENGISVDDITAIAAFF